MSARGTTLAQGFSQKLMLEMYDHDLAQIITNTDYEGEINAVGSKLNILNFDRVTEKTYTNTAMTYDSLGEDNMALVIDRYKAFYWARKTLEEWLSYIKNPKPTIIVQTAAERNRNKDLYLLGLYGDIGAGNRIGTNYSTGTVAVTATTGAVTGSGTTFTAAMVGKGFKADGHTTWYRVKSYASATSIVIEDDLDDATSAYTGGAIAGGSTYEVEAATAVSITTANLLQYVGKLGLKLDEAEANGYNSVPDTDRFLVAPPIFFDMLTRASGVALHVPEVYSDLIQKGYMGDLLGFKLFKSNRLTGNNTDGYHIIAGHKSWMTFADKVLQVQMEEDLPGDFGTAYKDLYVYGAKVTDPRRHFAAELFATFA